MVEEAMGQQRRPPAPRRRKRVTGQATSDDDARLSGETDLNTLSEGTRQVVDRLRRIEGQVRGLQRMIIAEEECEAVLTQVMAARAALDQVAGQVVLENLEACFAARSPAVLRQKAARTIQLLSRNA
jgi:DNA-binding FrmR family transcriptional regulator